MRGRTKYAAIGYVVSKFVLPLARRQAKKAARNKARGAVVNTADAAKRHPARTSIAIGSALGAIGWLATRSRTGEGDDTGA